MVSEILNAVLSGAAGGAVASLVVLRFKRVPGSHKEPERNLFAEFPEQQARQAARQWSEAKGMPEAEGVVLNKLRLGWELQQRGRSSRKRRPW